MGCYRHVRRQRPRDSRVLARHVRFRLRQVLFPRRPYWPRFLTRSWQMPERWVMSRCRVLTATSMRCTSAASGMPLYGVLTCSRAQTEAISFTPHFPSVALSPQ